MVATPASVGRGVPVVLSCVGCSSRLGSPGTTCTWLGLGAVACHRVCMHTDPGHGLASQLPPPGARGDVGGWRVGVVDMVKASHKEKPCGWYRVLGLLLCTLGLLTMGHTAEYTPTKCLPKCITLPTCWTLERSCQGQP